MFYLVLVAHMVLCVIVIGLVLLQQGKGASVGVSFGGGSNTVFGAAGAGNVLTKATTIVAVLLMLTSLVLIKLYAGSGTERSGAPVDPLKGSVMERSVSSEAVSSEVAPDSSAGSGVGDGGKAPAANVPAAVAAPVAPEAAQPK